MIIDVITERDHFGFFQFLGNGKEFSGEFFIMIGKFFRIFYIKMSTYYSPPLM